MSKYDKASLVMIPSGYKAEKVYSVLPVNGDGDFTFDRNSTATRVNKDGYIETVATDTPRLDYPLIDGVVQDCPSLLLEPVRTNIMPRSEDIDTGWSKSNVTVANNQTISPNGTLDSGLATVTSTNGQHVIYDNLVSSVTAGADYFTSCFVKKSTTRYIRLYEGYSGGIIYVDLDTNSIISETGGASESIIKNYGNGWFRIGFKFTADSSGNSQFAIYLNDNSNNNAYAGNGEAIYLWGAQIEQGSYPTSYIPTSGSAVTRAAETANGAGTSAEFNGSEGVIMYEISSNGNNSDYRLLSLNDYTVSNNFIQFGYANNLNQLYKQFLLNGVNIFPNVTSPINQSLFNKIAIKYKSGNSSFYVNGFEIDSSTTTYSQIAVFSELKFQGAAGSLPFHGKTKEIAYFKEALTDSELESLTSWDSFNDMATGQEYSIK